MSLSTFRQKQAEFNRTLEQFLQTDIQDVDIRERIRYCLQGGKRLRPIICLDIGQQLSTHADLVQNCTHIAIALELIHNASLIIDDMPAMDNDQYRRGVLAFHAKYSLSDAQATAAFLLQKAVSLIMTAGKSLPGQFQKILQTLTKNLGILGLAGGQLQDLTPFTMLQKSQKTKKELIAEYATPDMIRSLFLKKTCSLFEMAFCCGYLGAHGSQEYVEQIEKAAYHFGIAFQIYDDYDDIEQDLERSKTGLFDPNYINNFGLEAALQEFQNALAQVKELLTPLGLYSTIIEELVSFLDMKVQKKHAELCTVAI